MSPFLKIVGGFVQQKNRTNKKRRWMLGACSNLSELKYIWKKNKKPQLEIVEFQVLYRVKTGCPICQLVYFPEMTDCDHCNSCLGPISMGNGQHAPAHTQPQNYTIPIIYLVVNDTNTKENYVLAKCNIFTATGNNWQHWSKGRTATARAPGTTLLQGALVTLHNGTVPLGLCRAMHLFA